MSHLSKRIKSSSVRFTDYKGTFQSIEDIYSKYPSGGVYGWFCQVNPLGEPGKSHWVYWDKDLREWKPIDEEDLADILGLSDTDKDKLDDRCTIVWDVEKRKFVVKSGNVWNKLLDGINSTFSQVTKFLNLVDTVPIGNSDSGIYLVYSNDVKGLYVVVEGVVRKIFNSTDWYNKDEIDKKYEDLDDAKLDRSEVENLSSGIIFKDIQVNDISDLTNPLLNGEVPRDRWGIYVISEDRYYQYDASTGEWNRTPYREIPDNSAYNHLKVIQNNEFLMAIVDSREQLLFGARRRDGSFYMPSVSENVKAEIANAVAHYAYLLDALFTEQIDGWVEVKRDKDGAIIEGIRSDGSKYIAKGMSEDARKAIIEHQQAILSLDARKVDVEEGKSMIDSDVAESVFYEDNSENHIAHVIDRNKRILSYRQKDGTQIETKLHVPFSFTLGKQAMTNFATSLKDGGFTGGTGDWSEEKKIALPKPRKAAKVNITIGKLPTSKTDDIPCVVEYWDFDGNYFKCNAIINAQGTSSMAYPIKNLSVDLFNELGDSLDVKFGNWVFQDSFHWKKYYIDNFRGQCNVGYNLYEEFIQSRPYGERRPDDYLHINKTTLANGIGSLNEDFDTGSLYHPDGFPFTLYVNNEFEGVYVWNLKKHRDNYRMKKDNDNHILLDGELNATTFWGGNINWTQFEVRNPKGLIDINGSKYDGDNPKELSNTDPFSKSVKDKVVRLSNAIAAIRANKTKEEYEKYFLPKEMIDYMIFSQVIMHYDGFSKNWIWGLWDGEKAGVNVYDLDSIFNLFFKGNMFTYNQHDPASLIIGNNSNLPSGLCIELYRPEMNARYKELRDKGIISIDHIIQLFEEWTKQVGYDNYKAEFKKLPETPSYRPHYINEEYWRLSYYDSATSSTPKYSESTNYTVGQSVKYGKTELYKFECVKACVAQPPITKFHENYPYELGVFNSIARIKHYLELRIPVLDTYFKYNN